MGVKPYLIEVLTVDDGITFDDAMRNHREIVVNGRRVPVIGREALIHNEKAAARPQDLADVDWLEAHPVDDR
jgi:hypothetical protein